MRHEKSALLIELARELANSKIGLTLDEMCERINIKRRTAERMRDRLLDMFDTMEEVKDPPTKRWRICGGLDGFLLIPTAKEMAALKSAQEYFAKHDIETSKTLEHLEGKVNSAIGAKATRLAPDIEALMQTEAIAVTQGPKNITDPYVLNILRDSLLRLKKLSFNYMGGSSPNKIRIVDPYGIIFSGDAYLIAKETRLKTNKPKLWRIDKITSPKVLDEAGGPPDGFSLKEYSQRSFGVFQEETPHNVLIKVLPEYKEEAERWSFHSSQTIEINENDEMLIRLQGYGLRELAWSLFRWGGKIKIIEPPELIDEMQKAINAANSMIIQD